MSNAMPFDELSAYLDQELTDPQATTQIQHGLGEHLPALVEVRNMESLSRACKNLSQTPPSMDFESSLFARLDALDWAQEDPQEDFENLSAYTDGEWQPEETPASESAEIHLHNLAILSQTFKLLPPVSDDVHTDFAERLMAVLPEPSPLSFTDLSAIYDQEQAEPDLLSETACLTLRSFAGLTQAMQALPQAEPSANFFSDLEALLDTSDSLSFEDISASHDQEADLFETLQAHPVARQDLHNLQILSQAMQALPAPVAPDNFIDKLMSRIEQQEQTPSFEALSAHFDQPESALLSETELARPQAQKHLHNLKAVSGALQELPSPQASPAFLDKLSGHLNAVEKQQKKKIFAVPSFMKGRYARMVAGIAFFGLLVSFSQQMLENQMAPTQEAGTAAVIPTDHVVRLENQAEDELFINLGDSLEDLTDNDYNNLIEG
jgi:hypothetical protein